MPAARIALSRFAWDVLSLRSNWRRTVASNHVIDDSPHLLWRGIDSEADTLCIGARAFDAVDLLKNILVFIEGYTEVVVKPLIDIKII